MNSLILRTLAPLLVSLMVVFSVFVLLRGHNEAGGGFIGGLIAASAFAIYGIANGVQAVRRALPFQPMAIAAFGLLLAAGSGLIGWFYRAAFLQGIWWRVDFPGGVNLHLSTPLIFDIGVYLVVVGAIVSIVLTLEEE